MWFRYTNNTLRNPVQKTSPTRILWYESHGKGGWLINQPSPLLTTTSLVVRRLTLAALMPDNIPQNRYQHICDARCPKRKLKISSFECDNRQHDKE